MAGHPVGQTTFGGYLNTLQSHGGKYYCDNVFGNAIMPVVPRTIKPGTWEVTTDGFGGSAPLGGPGRKGMATAQVVRAPWHTGWVYMAETVELQAGRLHIIGAIYRLALNGQEHLHVEYVPDWWTVFASVDPKYQAAQARTGYRDAECAERSEVFHPDWHVQVGPHDEPRIAWHIDANTLPMIAFLRMVHANYFEDLFI